MSEDLLPFIAGVALVVGPLAYLPVLKSVHILGCDNPIFHSLGIYSEKSERILPPTITNRALSSLGICHSLSLATQKLIDFGANAPCEMGPNGSCLSLLCPLLSLSWILVLILVLPNLFVKIGITE
jgi:hypothetical protein